MIQITKYSGDVMKKRKELPVDFRSGLPVLELTGNRRVTVEGSAGILKYESELVRLNTSSMVISFCGRGLTLRCISATSVVVEGYITNIDFMT